MMFCDGPCLEVVATCTHKITSQSLRNIAITRTRFYWCIIAITISINIAITITRFHSITRTILVLQ